MKIVFPSEDAEPVAHKKYYVAKFIILHRLYIIFLYFGFSCHLHRAPQKYLDCILVKQKILSLN